MPLGTPTGQLLKFQSRRTVRAKQKAGRYEILSDRTVPREMPSYSHVKAAPEGWDGRDAFVGDYDHPDRVRGGNGEWADIPATSVVIRSANVFLGRLEGRS